MKLLGCLLVSFHCCDFPHKNIISMRPEPSAEIPELGSSLFLMTLGFCWGQFVLSWPS